MSNNIIFSQAAGRLFPMLMIKYLNGRVSQGFVAIYSARMMVRVSLYLLSMFLPIFLYILFDLNFRYVVYFYLIGHLAYALTVSIGCRFLNRIGLSRALRVSIVLGALYYYSFYLLDQLVQQGTTLASDMTHQVILLASAAVFFQTLHRIFYWTPLHTDLAKFTDKENRGKELSLIEATTLFLGATMPLVAGWILTNFNYDVLFIISITTYLMALIPLAFLPRTEERFSWSYKKTWKEFFSKKRRRAVLAFAGNGAEDSVGMVVWPIFIWEILQGNYFEVGALSSLIVAATIIMQLLVGRYIDLSDKQKMMKWGNLLYALGWTVKIFIATSFQIFIAATYHNISKIISRTPFDALNYEKAVDQGHYIDEYTVIHEMAFQFGKVIMLLFVLMLVSFFSIQWTFLLAALASLAMNYLADEKTIKPGRHVG